MWQQLALSISQMLLEEVDERLVPTLILAPHLLILQIATGGHEAVNLIVECMDLARYLQRFLERLDGLRILILGGKNAYRYSDIGSVRRVNHRRVSFGRG